MQLPSWARVQLQLLPHLLRRESSGRGRDPRITGFIPDDWQRQLLDVVDQGSCAVVCAPTSSGKTFISSYVIQKVIKPEAHAAAAAAAAAASTGANTSASSTSSRHARGGGKSSTSSSSTAPKQHGGVDSEGSASSTAAADAQLAAAAAAAAGSAGSKGVVVIVLPTKALVNQLAAQVYNDFGPGVHGVFTRDFRFNAQTCQVLLTVPACLEILLLSPANRAWVESLRYLIFDEVHCISELGGGDVWERLLLAVRCPWLALSATVGNPEVFRSWLQRVRDAQLSADLAAGLVPGVSAQLLLAAQAQAHDSSSGSGADFSGSNGSSNSSSFDGLRPAKYQVHLIQHKERYNELLAQVFVPQPLPSRGQQQQQPGSSSNSSRPRQSVLTGPIWTLPSRSAAATKTAAGTSSDSSSDDGGGKLVPLHPAASVTLQQLAKPAAAGGGWAPELPLSPEEALQLYEALVAAVQHLQAAATLTSEQQEQERGGAGNKTQHDAAAVQDLLEQLLQLSPERVLALPPALADAAAGSTPAGEVASLSIKTAGAAAAVAANVAAAATDPKAASAKSGSSKKGSKSSSENSTSGKPAAGANTALTTAGGAVAVSGAVGLNPADVFLSKQAAKAWTRQLVMLMEQWASASAAADNAAPNSAAGGGTTDADVCAVPPTPAAAAAAIQLALESLTSGPAAAMAADEAAWHRSNPTDPPFDFAYQKSHLLQLILSLRKAGQLPAILFNFERGLCMAYGDVLCRALAEAEGVWREQHAAELKAERRKLDAMQDASAASLGDEDEEGNSRGGRQRGRAAAAPDDGGAGGSGGSDVELRTVIVGGVVASADEGMPDPSFTLLPYDKARSQELWETISDLAADWTDPYLLRALSRGIGIHHSGLDTRYRQAVEMLFRSKHLQVVIATGTLAYGIHMPARCVVMAGDSPFLDALNFRQMSGRAGRRGLDNLGHVVFFSLPKHRVDALRVSQLPRLRGTLLPNPGLLLRMLLLHQQLSSNKPAGGTAALQPPASSSSSASAAAVAQGGQQLEAAHTAPPRAAISTPRHYQLASATTSLLTMAGEPFLTAADPVARQQLAHMTDFGLAYLAASHLIDAAGRPVGLAGLACHLFWTDPASLVLVRLLSSGAVHKVVQGVKAAGQGQQALHEALLLLVCGLFERMPLHPLEAKLWLGSRRHESSSVVVLPHLPSAVSEVIEQHNDQVLQLLVATLKQHMMSTDQGGNGEVDGGSSSSSRSRVWTEQQAELQQELSLPLSGCCYAVSTTAGSHSSSRGLIGALAASAVPAVLASPFMSLCGAGDAFTSLSELLLAGKQWLRSHKGGIPLMAMQDRRGQELALNAFALDYFKHGQKSELVRANGMLEGDAWQRLKSMCGVLAAISNSLDHAVEASGTRTPGTTQQQRQGQGQQRSYGSGRQHGGGGQQHHRSFHPFSSRLAGPQDASVSAGGDVEDVEDAEQQANREVADAFRSLSEEFKARFQGFNTGP